MGVDKTTLVDYWKAEGMVHLEMACPVWHSSLTLAQSMSLERFQRVAMAAIVGYWVLPLTDQLLDLGLERLDARRVKLCRKFAHSTATKSCHKDIFTITQNNHQRLAKISYTFVEPLARITIYRKSSVPYRRRPLTVGSSQTVIVSIFL